MELGDLFPGVDSETKMPVAKAHKGRIGNVPCSVDSLPLAKSTIQARKHPKDNRSREQDLIGHAHCHLVCMPSGIPHSPCCTVLASQFFVGCLVLQALHTQRFESKTGPLHRIFRAHRLMRLFPPSDANDMWPSGRCRCGAHWFLGWIWRREWVVVCRIGSSKGCVVPLVRSEACLLYTSDAADE